LDEELRRIQLEKQEAHAAIEMSLQERDLLLKKKELEWGQLIQELEQFLYKLERRHRAHDTIHAVWSNGLSGEQPILASSESVPLENVHGENDSYAGEDEDLTETGFDDRTILGNSIEIAGFQNGGIGMTNGKDYEEESKQSPLTRRDSAPLKFSPKRSAGPKVDA
jgi:hypothetical protein